MALKTHHCSILKTFLPTLKLKQIFPFEDETMQASVIPSYNLSTRCPLGWGEGGVPTVYSVLNANRNPPKGQLHSRSPEAHRVRYTRVDIGSLN